jgi:hypothetical protein
MLSSLLVRLTLAMLVFTTSAYADQQGAQVYSKQPFGYGKVITEMQLSPELGIRFRHELCEY